MKITDGEKTMTLEELAMAICHNISGAEASGCFDGSCPAEEYCRHGHNGMIDWLRQAVGE